MYNRFTVPFVSLLTVLHASPIAASGECPAADGERIMEILDQAPTCDKSLALFKSCSYGASGDVALSEVVVKKCENDFLTELSEAQRRTYDAEQERCARKYEKQTGTMYRSFEAFCSAGLARAYAQRFGKADKHQKARRRPIKTSLRQ
jgi:hypothetical protein